MNAYHLNHPPPSSKMITFWAVVNFGDCERVYFLYKLSDLQQSASWGSHILSYNESDKYSYSAAVPAPGDCLIKRQV